MAKAGLVYISSLRLFLENFFLAAALTWAFSHRCKLQHAALFAALLVISKEFVETQIDFGTGAVSDAGAALCGACVASLYLRKTALNSNTDPEGPKHH